MAAQRYRVEVSPDLLRFSAAHFIAYPGFREPLHGHNYQMSVRVDAALGPDGYVLDFGVVKRAAEELCAELTERTIVPMRSDRSSTPGAKCA
jgi:6-pyruvoyltetrahydropterin/6-carboxytetrahydropterin synthase